MAQIKRFKGLNNVSDPLRLGLSWLVGADNVNITDTGAIEKRNGYAQAQTGSFTGAYTTLDFQRMYLVDNGILRTFEGAVLKTGLSAAPMHWAEINDQVFFNNGTDRGVILPDNTVLDWAWAVPAAPNVAPGTGTLPAGAYQVRCSYVLADGRETGTGDSAEITMSGTQSLTISDIPHIAGAVTKVYIAPTATCTSWPPPRPAARWCGTSPTTRWGRIYAMRSSTLCHRARTSSNFSRAGRTPHSTPPRPIRRSCGSLRPWHSTCST